MTFATFQAVEVFQLFDNFLTFWWLFDRLATTTINPIILDHNLGRASWWIRWWARPKYRGEWHGILESELPVGITTVTTTIINSLILNHNLGCTSCWVRRCARPEHQGEWRGDLGSKPSPVGIETLTRRVKPWSKATGINSSWSGCWYLDNWHIVKGYYPCGWTISERRRSTGRLGRS